MGIVSRFVENAMKLLSAAETALHSGHSPSDMTVLISNEGGIRMVVDSDWPLESLQSHHGAKMAYRVTRQDDRVCVEGREGLRTCRFESEDTRKAARLLLGQGTRYALIAR